MKNHEEKLIKVLEFYLSLHEADEIFSMIYDDEISVEEVTDKLKEYQNNEDY